MVSFSTIVTFADELLQYRLKKVVLNSRNVQRMDKKGTYIVRKLFAAYVFAPQQMPDKTILAIFREYVRINCPDEFEVINKEQQRYLFADAADARMELGDCYLTLQEKTRKKAVNSSWIERTKINCVNSANKPVLIDFNTEIFIIALMRVIADYISGMTDAYAEQEYRKLYGIDRDVEA